MKYLLVGFGVLAMATYSAVAQDVKTVFDDGQTHDVAHVVGADGRGTFRVTGDTTVNLLPGGWGGLDVRDNATVNVRGGAVGTDRAAASHRLSGQSVVNFHSGAIHRRFVQMSDKASLIFHGTGTFEHLQQIELRSGTPTLTFYLHEDASKREDVTIATQSFIGANWGEFDEYFDKDGKLHQASGSRKQGWRIATRVHITLTLPGATEPQTITVSVFDDNPLRNDEDGADSTSNPPTPMFGLHERFINFDGTIKEGHINFIPAPRP